MSRGYFLSDCIEKGTHDGRNQGWVPNSRMLDDVGKTSVPKGYQPFGYGYRIASGEVNVKDGLSR